MKISVPGAYFAVVVLILTVGTSCRSFKELNETDDAAATASNQNDSQAQDEPKPLLVVPENPTALATGVQPSPVEFFNPDSTFALAPDSNLVVYGMGVGSQPVRTSNYNILHTSLDLSFNFEKHEVIGTATHSLDFGAANPASIQFDARDMDVKEVRVASGASSEKAKFKYSGTDITVTLPKDGVGANPSVAIDYVAHPMRNGQKLGLYFVDGPGTDPSRPTQIWTLGQPEDNQYWFPTWDYPTDRMTFDIRLTVPSQMETVANGVLESQTSTSDGLRVDHWKLDKDHVAYLAAFAVGDFSETREAFRRADGTEVPLSYFVTPEYSSRAAEIFSETPVMMAFLEEKLNLAYPWPNYKQVTVQDFAAGGMENTTATILMHGVQHDERAALDYSPRNLIMHELAHQWFGDYVSAANWGNLGLNEGLASYFEELYLLETYGEAEKQIHAIEEREEYFEESKIFQRPVVWHGYSDPIEIYDDHTYEKASQAFGQLRFEIGDMAFYRGLAQFLTEYGGASATIENLERSLTQSTGRDLSGFFQQWFYTAGHPALQVSAGYRGDFGIYQFKIVQRQTEWGVPVFSFPVDIEVVLENRPTYRERVYISSRDTTIAIGIAGRVQYGSFNRFDNLFAEVEEMKPVREWINQAGADDDMSGRYKAMKALAEQSPSDDIRDIAIDRVIKDSEYFVRVQAAKTLARYGNDKQAYTALVRSATLDESAKVRRASIDALSMGMAPTLETVLVDALADSSYRVVAAAVSGLASRYPERTLPRIQSLGQLKSWNGIVEMSIIDAAVKIGTPDAINLLTGYLDATRPERQRAAATAAIGEIAVANPEISKRVKDMLKNMRSDQHATVRAAAVGALDRL